MKWKRSLYNYLEENCVSTLEYQFCKKLGKKSASFRVVSYSSEDWLYVKTLGFDKFK